MNQKELEIIFWIIITIIVLWLSFLILISNKKSDVDLIKKQLIWTLKLKNIHINIFIIIYILLYLFLLYTNPRYDNIELLTTILPIAIIYTSLILTWNIFINSNINKWEIMFSRVTFSLWNISIRWWGWFPKYISKVNYNNKWKKQFWYMTSFYEKIWKKMYILVDKKDGEKVYPLFILIFKLILLSLFFIISILASIDNILKLFQF